MNDPLIVGAGPVGLAAALFLARRGIRARVIEAREERSPWSKALAVNPRSLELLEESGVTAKLLERGLPMGGVRAAWRGRVLANLDVRDLRHRYPFLLALSQAVTERLLEDALVAAGGSVERGVRLEGCANEGDFVRAELVHERDGRREVHVGPWLLGADGAHSVVRKSVGVEFPGSKFERPWHLADVPLDTPLPRDRGHGFMLDEDGQGGAGGLIVLIPVVESHAPSNVWRVIGNAPDPVGRLPVGRAAGPPVWESEFTIAHRMAERLSVGRVYLAGDAAHVHSPLGARGMNLGLEDAWTFAALAAREGAGERGAMARYHEVRHPIDSGVVRRIETLTRGARGESAIARFLRVAVLTVVPRLPPMKSVILRTASGLDHRSPADDPRVTPR